jgi:hypothetical protein
MSHVGTPAESETIRRMELCTRFPTLLAAMLAAPAAAHHSYAEYDMSLFMLIEGRVTAWHLDNPHSSLRIEAVDENGDMQTWRFEGGARVFAVRNGVRDGTFREGELVRVVINRVRTGEPAGAMCFGIKTDGRTFPLNDGTCNAIRVVETWKSNGWLDSTQHLESRPARSGL